MLKGLLKKTFVYDLYKKHKNKQVENRLSGKYIFENRKKNSRILVLILAGYKDFCKDVVFERIEKFSPKDVDICIISSGLYSQKLSVIAKNNNWSYISCKKNNVCSAINIGINEFNKADLIFKIDEDIFVTKNFFNTLLAVYDECKKNNSRFQPSFIAPIIPINGFAHSLILDRLNLLKKYEELFEPVRIQAGPHRQIESNPEVAKFMWGKGKFIPHIDVLDEMLNRDSFEYITCPIKFSIGAILFDRQVWKDMGYFIPDKGNSMGLDEIQICQYAMLSSKPIIVSKNTCVGHLSFGKQNAEMKDYYLNHMEMFKINQ